MVGFTASSSVVSGPLHDCTTLNEPVNVWGDPLISLLLFYSVNPVSVVALVKLPRLFLILLAYEMVAKLDDEPLPMPPALELLFCSVLGICPYCFTFLFKEVFDAFVYYRVATSA